jgi:hypothetical protein
MIKVQFTFPCGSTKDYTLDANMRGLRVGRHRPNEVKFYYCYSTKRISNEEIKSTIIQMVIPTLNPNYRTITIEPSLRVVLDAECYAFLRNFNE